MQWYYSEDVIGNLTAKTIEIVYWVVYPVDAIRMYWYYPGLATCTGSVKERDIPVCSVLLLL